MPLGGSDLLCQIGYSQSRIGASGRLSGEQVGQGDPADASVGLEHTADCRISAPQNVERSEMERSTGAKARAEPSSFAERGARLARKRPATRAPHVSRPNDTARRCAAAGKWRGPESNWRHHDFQSCALPTELPRRSSPLIVASALLD